MRPAKSSRSKLQERDFAFVQGANNGRDNVETETGGYSSRERISPDRFADILRLQSQQETTNSPQKPYRVFLDRIRAARIDAEQVISFNLRAGQKLRVPRL